MLKILHETRGFLRLDARARRIWIREEELEPLLSDNQVRLLEQIYKGPGEVVSREELITLFGG